MSKYRNGSLIGERKWYQNIHAMIALIGAFIVLVFTLVQIFDLLNRPAPKVQDNFEIVLDRSENMNDQFEGATKFDKAVEAVENTLEELITRSDNLALRQFGGPCSVRAENTKLLVDFDLDNVEEVLNSLKNIKISGEGTLKDAILSAIADFNDVERFSGVSKRIIIITGSGGDCVNDIVQPIKRRLQNRLANGEMINIDFSLIGLGIPIEKEKNLWQVALSTDGDVFFPKSRRALEEAIRNAIEGKSTKNVIITLKETFNSVTEHLNEALRNLKRGKYLNAERSLLEARYEFTRLDHPLKYLNQKDEKEPIPALLQLALRNRDIQEQLLDLAKNTLTQRNRGNVNAIKTVKPKLNKLIQNYRQNRSEMNEILNQLMKPII